MMRLNENPLLKSLSTSVMSSLFQTAPELIINTTPEEKRSSLQNVVTSVSNVATDYVAGGLMNSEISPVTATLAMTTLGVTKALTLKERASEEIERKDHSKEIIQDITSATTQRTMSLIAKSKLALTPASPFRLTSVIGLFAVPLVQNARVPGEPQIAPENRTFYQEIGQGFVNSAIAVGITLSSMATITPTVLAVALIGSGTAIIANTIIGKKPHR